MPVYGGHGNVLPTCILVPLSQEQPQHLHQLCPLSLSAKWVQNCTWQPAACMTEVTQQVGSADTDAQLPYQQLSVHARLTSKVDP